jgi:polyether ionophore transport system permease protein
VSSLDGAPALAPARPRVRSTRYEAVWRIARLRLRCDRTRLVWFMLLLGALAFIQPVGYRHSYPTIADRVAFAHAFGGDRALRLLYGVPDQLLTVGGYTSWRIGQLAALIVAVWAALAAVGALRAEEESGLTEVLLALPVSRRAVLAGTLVALAAQCAALAGALLAGLLAAGLPLGGSLVLAIAACSTAPVFGSVGALAAQLAQTSRRALELALGAVAAAFAVRVVADTIAGAGWLRWLSALGWVELTRPFASPRVAVLLAPACAAAVALGASVAIASRRDLGTGSLGDAGSHRPRLRLLGSPLAFSLRRERPALIVWAAAIAAFGCLLGAVSDAVSAAALPTGIRHAFGRVIAGSVVTPAGYLGFASLTFMLAISLFTAAQLSAARREEADGSLSTLLALPLTASRWLAGRLLLVEVAIAALSLVLSVCLWAGASAAGAPVSLLGLLQAGANCVAVASLFAGIGAIAYALLPAIAGTVTYALVAAAFLWRLFGAVLGAPTWLLDLTPFAHLGLAPAVPFRATAAGLIALVGAAGLLAGPTLLRRRDLGGQ